MTVEELSGRMSSRELSEWAAYFAIEPFGEERADLRAGIVASTIANVHAGRKGKPFAPVDFMPFQERDKSQKLSAQILGFFKNRGN
jgi:hypothetical protein